MRAARFLGDEKIGMVEVAEPQPGPGQVVLDVAFCGLCGSERKYYRLGADLTPGHEVSGTVIDANGTDIKVGTRAAAYLSIYCGECRYCRVGFTNRCQNRQGAIGIAAPWHGGYAERMVVPARNILPLDDGIGLETGVLLLDTFGTAWHGLRMAAADRAARGLVIGCGPLGLGAVAGMVAFGVPEVFASDLIATRRQAAAELGATPVEPSEIAALEKFDVVVEVVGSQKTIMQSIQAVAPGGRVVMLGELWEPWLFEPTRETMLTDFSLIRSWYFPINEFAANQRLIRDGAVPTERLISHVFPGDALDEAFRLFVSGESRKVPVEG